jgi:arylsulfatase A-like enzyme
VPAILKVPGQVEGGKTWDRPMISMDLMPTFLSLADPPGTLPPGMDGQNILPVLRGEKPPHETLFWSFNKGRAIRSGDWKLILNPPQFPGEEIKEKAWLSNLEADPSERTNLAGAEASRVAEMTAKVRAWEKDVGLPEPE